MHGQLVKLRVKIKNLAAEIRDIRLEERRALGKRKAKKKRGPDGKRDPKWYEFRGRDDGLRLELQNHRKYEFDKDGNRKDLRTIQRCALLAYAFLRGRAYAEAERSEKAIRWDEVHRVAEKFGETKIPIDTLKAWKAGEPSPFAEPAEATAT